MSAQKFGQERTPSTEPKSGQRGQRLGKFTPVGHNFHVSCCCTTGSSNRILTGGCSTENHGEGTKLCRPQHFSELTTVRVRQVTNASIGVKKHQHLSLRRNSVDDPRTSLWQRPGRCRDGHGPRQERHSRTLPQSNHFHCKTPGRCELQDEKPFAQHFAVHKSTPLCLMLGAEEYTM